MNIDNWKLLNPCKDCDGSEELRLLREDRFYTLEGDCCCDDYIKYLSGRDAQIQLLECLVKNGSTYIARDGLKAMLKEIKDN